MSRRKDRERFLERKQLDPSYEGFRGFGQDQTAPETALFQGITCSICGRRRNVLPEVAEGDSYVCMSCREETEAKAEGELVTG